MRNEENQTAAAEVATPSLEPVQMKSLTDIRDQIEDATNVVHLLVDLATSGAVLGEKSRAALLDIGVDAIGRLDRANLALRRYDSICMG